MPPIGFYPQSAPRKAQPFVAAAWLRAWIAVLVLGLVAQATALSTQRVLGRAHHHVAIEHGAERGDGHAAGHDRDHHGHDGHDDHDHGANGHGRDHRGLGNGHGHNHHDRAGSGATGLSSDHDHPRSDATAVYVIDADHGHAPGHGPAPSRTVAGLDGLMPGAPAAPGPVRVGRWVAAGPAAAESPPPSRLERPPRG